MTIWRLVIREAGHRKLNFGLSLLAVAVAVGTTVAALTMLGAHDLRTEAILATKRAETARRMAVVEDDYRKITKLLGFNVLILPENQDLGDLYADNLSTVTMPESYVEDLSNSSIMSIRHLLPSLEQKVRWVERARNIILVGVKGEVPIKDRAPKEPMLLPVPAGSAVVGHELCRSLGLAEGDSILLNGKRLKIHRIREEQANRDDVTIWIDLAEAQELLGRPGRISGILALKCHCYGLRLGELRKEIVRILPGTRVVEFGTKVITRAEARDRAADIARESLSAEEAHRETLRTDREQLVAVVVPAVVLAGVILVGFLSFINVRGRLEEIGILRALGLATPRLLGVFLTRAILTGLAGALPGGLVGALVGSAWGGAADRLHVISPLLWLVILLAAPLLAALASWLPALWAARQDPAVILGKA